MSSEYRHIYTVFHFQMQKIDHLSKYAVLLFTTMALASSGVQGGPKKLAHGVYGNNFVYSHSFFIIFGTCTL